MLFEIGSVIVGLIILGLIWAGRLTTQVRGVAIVMVVSGLVFGVLTLVG